MSLAYTITSLLKTYKVSIIHPTYFSLLFSLNQPIMNQNESTLWKIKIFEIEGSENIKKLYFFFYDKKFSSAI